MKKFHNYRKRLIGISIGIGLYCFLCHMQSPVFSIAAELEMDNQSGGLGGQVVFALTVNGAPNNVTSLGVNIGYRQDVLEYVGTDFTGTLLEGWTFKQVSNPENGVLRLGGIDISGFVSGAGGVLVRITFKVISVDDCRLTLSQLKDDLSGWTTKEGFFAYEEFVIDPITSTVCVGGYATLSVAPEGVGIPPFTWWAEGTLLEETSRTLQFRSSEARSYLIKVQDSSIPPLEAQATAAFVQEDDSGALDIVGGKGASGAAVNVEVRVQNATNEVSALGFDLVYDPNVLTYNGFSRGGLVEAFDFFDVNLLENGRLRCGGVEAGNEKISVGASGTLIQLNFTVVNLADCKSTSLDFDNVKDQVSSWDVSGACFLANCGCDGDINGDGQITPQDALCAFETYMLVCPTSCSIPCEDICCDVSQDANCTPADALCIFQKYMGYPSCLD